MMADNSAPLVLREDKGAIALLLLNRPAQRNALRYESWSELSALLVDAAADADVRGIVLAGVNGFFCAGGDLKTSPAHGVGPLGPAGRVEHAQRVLEQIKAVPVPTVAAVEGAAVGLGWSLHWRAISSSPRQTHSSAHRSWLVLSCLTGDWPGD
jgi:enoyl-CoA hydratase/carnithine racemase